MAVLGLAAVTASTMMLAGCGGSGDGGSSAGGEGLGDKATLSIFVYGNEQEQAIYTNMINQFKEAHADEVKDIEVQYSTKDDYGTTLTGMMTAKELPDVYYIGPETVSQYVDNGYAANLTPYLEELGLKTDDLMQDILNFYRYDGTTTGQGDLYGLPHDASVIPCNNDDSVCGCNDSAVRYVYKNGYDKQPYPCLPFEKS